MPVEVSCPRCHKTLQVAEGVEGKWLTCPYCLASVRNPADEGAPRQAVQPERPAPGADTCPGCGAEVRPGWRTCPACGEPLGASRPAQRGRPGVERDTGKDMGITGLLLILLGLLGVVGYVGLLASGALDSASPQGIASLTFGVGFALLLLVVVGIVLGVRGQNVSVSVVSGVLGGLVISGLVLLLLMAVTIFAIATCVQVCSQAPKTPPVAPAPAPRQPAPPGP